MARSVAVVKCPCTGDKNDISLFAIPRFKKMDDYFPARSNS